MVYQAYLEESREVKAAGVDGMDLVDLESDLANQLYKLWNRLSSGSYFPPAVRQVEIGKRDGGVRKLGIPTILDRIAQRVFKEYLTPRMEKMFHADSWGYRPGRSQAGALRQTQSRLRCYRWVIDMDIRSFFDEIDHSLLLKALDRHVTEKWVKMYIVRWLEAGVQDREGNVSERTSGTPQGGVISPLLSNVFLHYVFDKWMSKNSSCPFTRFADDMVVYCRTRTEAEELLSRIKTRFEDCKLRLHPKKTKIVYCGYSETGSVSSEVPRKFTFLGFDFRPVKAFSRKDHRAFRSFGGVPSTKRMADIVEVFKTTIRPGQGSLEAIADKLNPKLRSWIGYYCLFNPWAMKRVMRLLNRRLARWISKKYKRFRYRITASFEKLRSICRRQPMLFAHWQRGYKL